MVLRFFVFVLFVSFSWASCCTLVFLCASICNCCTCPCVIFRLVFCILLFRYIYFDSAIINTTILFNYMHTTTRVFFRICQSFSYKHAVNTLIVHYSTLQLQYLYSSADLSSADLSSADLSFAMAALMRVQWIQLVALAHDLLSVRPALLQRWSRLQIIPCPD